MVILQLLAVISVVALLLPWSIAVVRNATLPVPATFRNRLVGLSVVGLLTALVPVALMLSGADLVPLAVVIGVDIAFLLVAARTMDRWTAHGRMQLVREGRDAYSGLPTTRRGPDSPDLR